MNSGIMISIADLRQRLGVLRRNTVGITRSGGYVRLRETATTIKIKPIA
jgi:hypothetical protein